jgi:hypothetical protein
MKRFYQNQVDAAQAAGKSQVEIFAARKKLYQEDQRLGSATE